MKVESLKLAKESVAECSFLVVALSDVKFFALQIKLKVLWRLKV